MSALVIKTDEEAFSWLEKYLEGKVTEDDIIFEGWPTFSVRLTGSKFHQSLTPSVMQGFVEFQKSINRYYALSKYGVENSGRLTPQERLELEIKVKVENGSTVLEVNFQEFLTNVAYKAITTMEPVHVVATVVSLGVIWGTTTIFKKFLDNRKEVRMQEVKTESEREHLNTMQFMSAEETKRVQIIGRMMTRNPELENAARHADDARTDLLKRFSSAETAEIGDIVLDPETTQELLANSRRTSYEIRLDGEYQILGNDTTDPLAFKVRVRNVRTGDTFEALVQTESLNDKHRSVLQRAEWERGTAWLGINARLLGGKVKNAVVLSVKDVETAQAK